MAAAAPRARALTAAALAVAAAASNDTSDATPTPPAIRYTWTECACKATWEMQGVDGPLTCSEACCNLDDDPTGDYCYVVDPECEDYDRGYCRPETMSTPGCSDYPPGWADSDGDDCSTYSVMEFCTQSGGYGATWDEAWGKFQSFTADGHDASTACCACGGGSDTYQGYNDNECRDAEGWADSDGDACTSYSNFFWCNPEGRPGEGWHEEWGTFSDFTSGGMSADAACCACGGGSEGNYEGTHYVYTPDGDTAGVEVPSGEAWAVASGPCTKDGDDCIQSPNYPNDYGVDEKCVIGVNVDLIKPISAKPFSTEWGYDTMKINDQSYSGTLGPSHIKPLGAIVWSSDYDTHASGWRLCQEGAASDASGDVALEGTSPTASPAPSLGTLDTQSKGMGMIVVLGVLAAVAGACWLKMRRSTPDSGIGEGMPRRMGTA